MQHEYKQGVSSDEGNYSICEGSHKVAISTYVGEKNTENTEKNKTHKSANEFS